jgi:hypothetical protein
MSVDETTPEFGETWVYESIVGALPGISLSRPVAIAIQLSIFQTGLVLLAWYYDLWSAAVAGTGVVFIAAVGSVEMLRIGSLSRTADVPDTYSRLLFGSSVEVVLGVLAFIALVTHLFVFDPMMSTNPLVPSLFGERPPVIVVYLTLLVLWDVCYRIGTNWWAAVVAVWRSARYEFDPETRRSLARLDLETMAFGIVQLVLAPFIVSYPVLLFALVGHVVAVVFATGLSVALLRVKSGPFSAPT